MEQYISVVGLVCMLFFAWLLSDNKKKMDWRLIGSGLAIQFALALLFFETPVGKIIFVFANDVITAIISVSDSGAQFVFGEGFREHFFAFKVLPTIIFVSSLSYLLFYWGILQKTVEILAWFMSKTMRVSGTESLVAAANIFCGQTEAPLLIKPYLKTMTRSEINTMMTTGMATVAGGVMAAYVDFGISAGHLLAGSLMSAPAAIVIARIIHPKTEDSVTDGTLKIQLEVTETNAFEAACKGASEGLKLCLNVGAMLIAFTAIIALINLFLGTVSGYFGYVLTFESILGTVYQPIAFLMGIPWSESHTVGLLLGEKMVINEFIAYSHLGVHVEQATLSERSITIATYALCGFANFASIAIQIGGIGELEPTKKAVFAQCAFKAMLGGTLAAFMTACIAGILI